MQKLDLDTISDKNNIIKTIKNIIGSNTNNINSKRIMDNKESDEKNKEDENINNNIEKENYENNNVEINKEESIKVNNQGEYCVDKIEEIEGLPCSL